MQVPLLDKHLELGQALYRQRNLLINSQWSDGILLASVEKRLRAHLFFLSHYIDQKEEIPGTEHAFFVYLCRRILADNEDIKLGAWIRAVECLKEKGPKLKAAYNALTLYPPYDDYTELLDIEYQNEPELMQAIFEVWHKQNTQVDSNRIQQALRNHDIPALQMTALKYAAYQPHCTLELFKPYYVSILDKTNNEVPHYMLEPAIWGGLIRQDPEAKSVLRRAIEQEDDEAQKRKLLRLGAISGDPEHGAILDAYRYADSNSAYYFLALLGNKSSMNLITTGLQQASDIDAAETAWKWMTDIPLPTIPRMQLVERNDREEEIEEDQFEDEYDLDDELLMEDIDEKYNDTVPDATVALQWWLDHQESWSSEDRYIAAKSSTASTLAQQASLKAGQAGRDILDLFAIEQKAPIGNLADTWIEIRNQQLAQKNTAPQSNGVESKVIRTPRKVEQYV
ncbi:hypothetical protein MNBD_GAMMA12-2568 [hydrothermal vent metagenome]|uniref:Uncharacterized protein n=1 Tax=hydrothermal vent metagenome TaxID=652676 RepID=A0A3B0Z2P6_9ZZZZ